VEKPCYLILPTAGSVLTYKNFEELFSFYPNGIKGLIKDYLFFHKRNVGEDRANPEDALTHDLKSSEDLFLEEVLELYEKSWDYRFKELTHPNCQHEFTIEMVCNDISNRIESVVLENEPYFNQMILNPFDIKWFGDCIAIQINKRIVMQAESRLYNEPKRNPLHTSI
jgi:hypothetical protein